MRLFTILLLSGLLLISLSNCQNLESSVGIENNGPKMTGKIVNGYREIEINPANKQFDIKLFRGDYAIFKFPDGKKYELNVPELSIKVSLPKKSDQKPYVKFKKSGEYKYSLGDIKGIISVSETVRSNYKEITASEATEIINNVEPLLLDVRTPGEYKYGHLQNSVLIPLQQIQSRYSEIEKHKEKPIVIYCATGNRSTVAARILLSKGFKNIYNLRRGIADWGRRGHPVVK